MDVDIADVGFKPWVTDSDFAQPGYQMDRADRWVFGTLVLILGLVCGFIVGVAVGRDKTLSAERSAMAKAGVGRFEVDARSGEIRFVYRAESKGKGK